MDRRDASNLLFTLFQMTVFHEQQSQEEGIAGPDEKIPKTFTPKAPQALGGQLEAVLK